MKQLFISLIVVGALVAPTAVSADQYGQTTAGQYGQGTVLGKADDVKVTHEVKETGLAENLTAVAGIFIAGSFYFFNRARKEAAFN